MSWLNRLKEIQAPDTQPTKTTKSVSVVLVATQMGFVKKNDGGILAANDPNPGPDLCCWPRSDAMNGREIEKFIARLDRFVNLGLDHEAAEKLADRLVARDRGGEDRSVCLECKHMRLGLRCLNSKIAGLTAMHSNSGLPSDFVIQLQSCPGFKAERWEANGAR